MIKENNFVMKPMRSEQPVTFTLQDVENVGFQQGWTKEQAETYFHRRNKTGWLDACGRPVTNLVSDMWWYKKNGFYENKGDYNFGRYCTCCGSSKNDGKLIWREKLPFIDEFHYKKWKKQQ